MATGWQGDERRSGRDRRVMREERVGEERRTDQRREGTRPAAVDGSVSEPGAAPGSSPVKDPEDWVTGDEPMTGAQRSSLHTLASEAGEMVPDTLSKADASRLIDELQARSWRGASPSDGIG